MANPRTKHLTTQLSVRSRFARVRASSLAKMTGMSITQVVEDALRAYQPAGTQRRHGDLIEKSGILVIPKETKTVTQAQVDGELEDIRSGTR